MKILYENGIFISNDEDYRIFDLSNKKFNIPIIKNCKNCDIEFVLNETRIDTLYCNECKEIGAINVYKNKIQNNELLKLYNREYQRRYSKIKNLNTGERVVKLLQIKEWRENLKKIIKNIEIEYKGEIPIAVIEEFKEVVINENS